MSEVLRYAEVILPFRFGEGTFTYGISDEGRHILPGMRVRVTFRKKEMIGLVNSLHSNKPSYKVLEILEVIDDEPVATSSQIELMNFASDYYADSIGSLFQAVLPSRIRNVANFENTLTAYRFIGDSLLDELNNREYKKGQYKALLQFAQSSQSVISRRELAGKGVSETVLRKLTEELVLEKTEIPRNEYKSINIPADATSDFSEMALSIYNGDTPGVDLVTGLLKSEMVSLVTQLSILYAKEGKMVLVMLPSADNLLVDALGSGSEDVITFFPSDSPSLRTSSYLRILTYPRSVRLLIGGRTSPFLPFKNLGHIIVLEEHDERYRGNRSPHFNGRDIALMLREKMSCKLLLLSSSPSLESVNSHYHLISNYRPYPVKTLEKGTDLLSKYSRAKMENVLSEGKNVLVFQNRRGYSGHVECSKCGNIPGCPRCHAFLSLHVSQRSLKCHYCGYSIPFDGKCPVCHDDVVTTEGYGTERMAINLSKLFPDYPVSILDTDRKDKFNPSARIIVGTSYMIRHDDALKDIGLVLVANGDNLLLGTDFRVTEKALRTLMALRAIAMENGAEYIVQTRDFRQPIFKVLEESTFDDFYRQQLDERRSMEYPPFFRMVTMEFRSKNNLILYDMVGRFHCQLSSKLSGCRVSPVFEPEVDKIDMEHIVKIVLRFPKTMSALQQKRSSVSLLDEWSQEFRKNHISVSLEIDPQ